MNIVIIGFKSCGKSATGKLLAKKLGRKFVDSDDILEEIYAEENGERLSFREIFNRHGNDFFRALEKRAVKRIAKEKNIVISVGGGTIVDEENARLFKKGTKLFYLKGSAEWLAKWVNVHGVPSFLDKGDLVGSVKRELEKREPAYLKNADYVINAEKIDLEKKDEYFEGVSDEIIKLLKKDKPI